jgi:ABC-type polysaccharide/polyol phosphate transport system ATPase subunit
MKKNSNQLAIKLVNLSKTYQLHHEKPTLVENLFGGNKESFTALKNINLEIKRGEKIGIIGPNGSGKTTLLKLISGIATPTKGSVKIWGKIVSLIDLSAGFHPELTGEENIFLNALLVGMGRDEVRSKYGEILEFADIGSFIDAPLYTYSDGMKLRLGFSIAVSADPDILILDEGTSVGDSNFQKKSAKKIDDFFKQKKTIISVSHWMEYLISHCNRVLRLDDGLIVDDGEPKKIISRYLKEINRD